ncbi:hypothetical protein MBANPS3_005521 [Mucor bainieri]
MKLKKNDIYRDCIQWVRDNRRNPDKLSEPRTERQVNSRIALFIQEESPALLPPSSLSTSSQSPDSLPPSSSLTSSSPPKISQTHDPLLPNPLPTGSQSHRPLSTSPQVHDQGETYGPALIVEEHNAEFEAMFKRLDESKKWYLSTGKCVDNELFIFAKVVRAACYFQLYGIFTREEIKEIKHYNHKPLPSASTEFKRFLNSYNLDSCRKICVALGQNQQIHADYDNGHNLPLEFGGSEAKSRIEEQHGSNFMKEEFLKLPKMLKDMLDVSLKKVEYDERTAEIRTVGLLYSGLSCTMVDLDRPTAYISRVSRSQTIQISSKIEQFGATVLPALLSSWTCCETVKEVLNRYVSQYFFRVLEKTVEIVSHQQQ